MSAKVQYLIVDTSAFIKNVDIHNIGNVIITTQDVVNEITSKRQLRRLVVLPYDLQIKETFPENVKFVTDFSKKTGDYVSLSSTDIKVIALTYQLEKQHVGVEHLKNEPVGPQKINLINSKRNNDVKENIVGFFSKHSENGDNCDEKNVLIDELESLEIKEKENFAEDISSHQDAVEKEQDDDCIDDILVPVDEGFYADDTDSDDDSDWITPSNISKMKEEHFGETDDKPVTVACLTTDFAMQNVLKQIGLNVAALDGKVIKQLRTFVLRCYSCFKLTSVMTKVFCPMCGNKTLKKVAVSLDKNGQQVVHINLKRPLTSRGKRYSLPTPQGGKHANNPILCEFQPIPDQKPTRLAKMKNNPMDPDYIAGYSPFIMRDVNSKSAMLGIRPGTQVKHWMKKNPNESRRRKK